MKGIQKIALATVGNPGSKTICRSLVQKEYAVILGCRYIAC